MTRASMKALLFAASSGLALLAAGAAEAQTPPPPEHVTLDARGVDLVSGEWMSPSNGTSIGSGGTGLSYRRTLVESGTWWDDAVGRLHPCGLGVDCTISIEGVTETFSPSGSGFVPKADTGSTLAYDWSTGEYTYTRGDGTVFIIVHKIAGEYPSGVVIRKTTPQGLVTNYNYRDDTQRVCPVLDPEEVGPGPVLCADETVSRLQSYHTNTGYMVHYDYASNVGWTTEGWATVIKVTALNLAVDPCDPLATTCTFSRTWPSVAHASGGSWASGYDVDTDQAGRQTIFTRAYGRVTAIRYPGSSADDVTVNYLGPVSSVTDASGTWTYSFTDSGSVRTAVSTSPVGETLTVVTDLTVGRPTSVTNGAGATTSYLYDADRRVTRVTRPEGDYTAFTYDARGNVTETRSVAKAGSGLADIVTSATYASGCSNWIICNLPLTTTDARGQVTDYTWDTTHGGLLTITAPAPLSGAARPQTRYTYAPQTAYYRNSAGVIAAAPSAVTLLTQVNRCATGSSCSGGANEVRTTMAYGSAGVANNLLPTTVSQGSGASPALAVTTVSYTANGDPEYIDGPLSGAADTTRYLYDTARQVVGVIGPDPDGAGAGQNRAQRMTFNPRGQVTVAESGNTAGYSDSNFASFTPVLRSETGYDAYGRPVVTRRQTGAGATVAVSQVSYDAAGRVDCTVVRMNPATFGSLPAAACTAATPGSDGPDRITRITTYDAASRPLTTTTAVGQAEAIIEARTYTTNGQIATMTDGAGNVSVQEYDGHDRPVRLRYPNAAGGGTSTTDYTEVGYDPAGNVTSSRNRAGQVTTVAYDNLNRPTLVDAPSGTMDVATTYDNLGRVLTVTGNGQTLTRTWDPLSNMMSEAGPLGTMSYQYDPAGRMTRITWPDSFHVQYDRDVYGAVTAIRENSATSGPGLLAVYGYGDVGQLTGIVRGNGTTTSYGYDAARRMTGMSHDLAGSAHDVVFGYAYNAAGQIAARSTSNPAYVYAPVTGGTGYSNNNRNQVTSIWGTPVTYDANQNIASGLGQSYVHDAAGRLVGTSAGGYGYDPAGRMYSASASGTLMSYAGAQLSGEHSSSGAMLVRHIPGPGLDQPIVSYSGAGLGTRTWLANDERQSVINLSDGSGNALTINRYDEYGMPGSGNAGRFQYTGQAVIEPGLYNYRNRAYAPQFGRFLQTDPIGYGDGMNVYGYVGGDPLNLTDPSGTAKVCARVLGGGLASRRCVKVDGDGDGNVDENDLKPNQIALLARSFAGFIVDNPDRNLARYGKLVFGNASESSKNFARVVSQFVGATMSDRGGPAASAWQGISFITANEGFFSNFAIAAGRFDDSNNSLVITGAYLGEGFRGSPYSHGSGLARLIIHESLHFHYRGDQESHTRMDDAAIAILRLGRLDGTGCPAVRGLYNGC